MNPKLIVFDINKTLVNDNSWAALNVALGMTPEEDELLFNLNQEGVVTNELWVKIVNNLYQKRGKATRANVEAAVLSLDWVDGAKQTVTDLKQKGYKLALISGGVDLVVEKVAHELDIDLYGYGGSLVFEDDGRLKEMMYLAEEVEVKKLQLLSFCRRLGIKPEEVVCVGDGDNDRELFTLTGHGITFKGSKIESLAWKVVDGLADVPAVIETN